MSARYPGPSHQCALDPRHLEDLSIVNDGAEIIKGAQAPYEFERVFRTVTDGQVAPLPAEEEASAAEEPVAEEDVPAEEAPAEEAPAEEPAAE